MNHPFWEEEHQSLRHRLEGLDVSAFEGDGSDSEARELAPRAVAWLGQQGWLELLRVPANSRKICLFREAVAGRSPLLDCLFAVQGLATVPLQLEGSPEQRQRWLEPALRGELVGAFAMTEPEAGSDVANIQTRASGEYRLNGTKCFISNGGIADYYVVFATLAPEQGSRGIAAFLVEGKHVELSEAQILSAPHPLGRVEFRDSPAELLCREGFKLGMRTLDTMRVSVAAAACGMAARALREATAHVLRRRQFGQAMADFQLVQQKLAQMAIQLEAAQLLTYRAAWQRDQGQLRNTREVAVAKAFATEQAQVVIDSSMQLLGGLGMLAQHPVERLYRAVRALRIYEGATEVQYLIIAKDLLKEYVDTTPTHSS